MSHSFRLKIQIRHIVGIAWRLVKEIPGKQGCKHSQWEEEGKVERTWTVRGRYESRICSEHGDHLTWGTIWNIEDNSMAMSRLANFVKHKLLRVLYALIFDKIIRVLIEILTNVYYYLLSHCYIFRTFIGRPNVMKVRDISDITIKMTASHSTAIIKLTMLVRKNYSVHFLSLPNLLYDINQVWWKLLIFWTLKCLWIRLCL